MARAIWTGSLSFGLVNVPVGLYTATEDRSIHFNQFQAGTSDRVRYKRVNERTGDEVDYADIVKGYDLGGGEHVLLSPEELQAVEPERSRSIDIVDFVDLRDIDPIYFQKTYYLAPQGEQAQRAYALLRQAMAEAGKVGVASLVLRNKEYLVAVRPDRRVLALETLFFADEVRDPVEELDTLPGDMTFSQRELDTAKLLIESMSTPWEPERYHATYRQAVEELVERKRQGEAVVTEAAPPTSAPVIDLMAALQASVEAARGGRTTRAGKASGVPPGSGAPVGSGAAPARPRSGRSVRRRRATPDLSALSRAELAERAAQLDIPGRSKMRRAELEQAVAAASSGSHRRRAS